jgi:hypothetical protein
MIDGGQADALLELDYARKQARDVLAALAAKTSTGGADG